MNSPQRYPVPDLGEPFRSPTFFLREPEPCPKIPDMTVCIAAICEHGKAAIMAADRLASHESIRTEYDSITKITRLSDRCVVGISGTHDKASAVLGGLTEEDKSADSIFDLTERILRERNRVRQLQMDAITERYLGVSLHKFTESEMPTLANQVLQLVYRQINEGLSLGILVAGVDPDGAAHLFGINDAPTGISRFNSEGFTVVGCGSPLAHAVLVNMGYKQSIPLEDAVFDVYVAKRMAEQVQGVGRKTDIAIISSDHSAGFLSRSALSEIRTLYKEKRRAARLSKSERKRLAADLRK